MYSYVVQIVSNNILMRFPEIESPSVYCLSERLFSVYVPVITGAAVSIKIKFMYLQ